MNQQFVVQGINDTEKGDNYIYIYICIASYFSFGNDQRQYRKSYPQTKRQFVP